MASVIAVETYQALLGEAPAHVAWLTTRITYQARPQENSLMRPPTLGTPATALLALIDEYEVLGFLACPTSACAYFGFRLVRKSNSISRSRAFSTISLRVLHPVKLTNSWISSLSME